MKSIKYIVVLIFSFYTTQIFAVKECDCPNFSQKIRKIQDAIDNRNYDSITERINALPTNSIICKQYAQLCRLQLYIAKDELSSADSLAKIINSAFKSNSCNVTIALYKYYIGTLFIKKNMADSALKYLINAKDLATELSDVVIQAKSFGRIAYLFENLLDQPEKALEYNRKAISLLQNSTEVSLLLLLNGNRSAYFGRIYDSKNDTAYLDSVYLNSLITLKLARQLKNNRSIANCYSMIAGVYMEKRQDKLAIQFCDSGIAILTPAKDARYVRALYTKKTDIYIRMTDFNNAKQFADSILKCAVIEDNVLAQASVFERLYEIEKALGNYDKALLFYEKHTKINDSIKSVEKTEVTNELEQKYNKSENEKRISELNRKNEVEALRVKFLIVGIIAAVLIILIIIFFYRQSILKSKFKALEVEQRLNRARMNPHFIFNALYSIQSLSLEPENQSKVSVSLSRFSKIIRQSLESTYNDVITIEEEMSFIENYLNIQKMRFPNKFDYNVVIADDIEVDELKMPSMLLQPFIENSIEHGFKDLNYLGVIVIEILKENELLKIRISDNGKGFENSNSNKKYPSRAVQIITERLAILNKQFHSNARFDLLNSSEGVKVEVFLPIIFITN